MKKSSAPGCASASTGDENAARRTFGRPLRPLEHYFVAVYFGILVYLVLRVAVDISGIDVAYPAVATIFEGSALGLIWFVGLVTVWFNKRRLRRQLAAAGYQLCLSCRHRLDPALPEGECPECGAAYELEKVRQQWLSAAAPLKPWRAPSRAEMGRGTVDSFIRQESRK